MQGFKKLLMSDDLPIIIPD